MSTGICDKALQSFIQKKQNSPWLLFIVGEGKNTHPPKTKQNEVSRATNSPRNYVGGGLNRVFLAVAA